MGGEGGGSAGGKRWEIVSSSVCERSKKTAKNGAKGVKERYKRHGDPVGESEGQNMVKTAEERYRETRENIGGDIRKAGKVVCEPGL